MALAKPDLLQGTLDLPILKALASAPLHGWAISKRIHEMSRDLFVVNQGSLYPALYRLEDRGWITGTESESAEGRRPLTVLLLHRDFRNRTPGKFDERVQRRLLQPLDIAVRAVL
jgi:PadR family transcriptional regulator